MRPDLDVFFECGADWNFCALPLAIHFDEGEFTVIIGPLYFTMEWCQTPPHGGTPA